jgi:acyl carrier protein
MDNKNEPKPMNSDQAAVKEKIRMYIQKSVHAEKDKIKDNTLIFREGFLDSMAFIVLITYLEEEFRIRTMDSDLFEDNFESINAITKFVNLKSDSRACAELQAS